MNYRHISAHLQRFVVLMLVINHLVIRPPWLIPYASELQTVVNDPIYNGNSYFITRPQLNLRGKAWISVSQPWN